MERTWERGRAGTASESKIGAQPPLQERSLHNWAGLDKKRPKSAPGTPHAGRRALSRAKRSKFPQSKRYPRDPRRSFQPPPSARKRVQSEPTSVQSCIPLHFPVSTVQGPGYVISRAKDSVVMKIDADKFFRVTTKTAEASERTGSRLSGPEYVPSDKIAMITQESLLKEENLQREIVDLNIKLEELRASYNKDVSKVKVELKKEKQQIRSDHEKELRLLQQSHDNHMIQTEERHKKKMKDVVERMTIEGEELKRALEESKRLLEVTKTQLEREKEEQMESMKESIATAHREQLELVGAKMLREQREEFDQMLDRLKKNHSQQLLAHEQQHQDNVKAILERTGNIKEMERQFAQAQDDNKALEEQLENLQEELNQTKKEKTLIEAKLLELQTDLDDFGNRFELRVREVELKYIDQIDGLRLQNSQLRKKALDLSVQTSQYQSTISSLKLRSRPSKSAMFQAVVKARMAANLSLAGDTALSPPPKASGPRRGDETERPASAPGTPKESERARTATLATDQRKLGRAPAQRPQSSIIASRLVRL